MINSNRVDVKIGFQCNNSCRFCIQANKRNLPDKKPEEVIGILIKERLNCDAVIFTGGEPTIYKELTDYVRYAKKLGYQTIHIQSNGRSFAYRDFCLGLIKAGANVFNPAIHGSNDKIHDYLTRSPGSFRQTMKGIRNLRSLKQRIFVNSVINRVNYQDLPNMVKMIVGFKPEVFQLAFMHINIIVQRDPALIKEIVPRYSQIEKYVKEGLRLGLKAGIRIDTEAIPYCFMKGYENHIAEGKIPDTNVYDANNITKNFNKVRKTAEKAKGPNCPKCKHNEACEGPWKDYPAIFGWQEFKPVKG